MRKWIISVAFAAGFAAVGPASAYDGFSSESAHVVGSAVAAGAVTALASDRWPEQRGWIGFGVVAGVSLLGELIPLAAGKTSRVQSAVLDISAELFGSAIGAWVTNKYLLAPVVSTDGAGHTTVGAVFKSAF